MIQFAPYATLLRAAYGDEAVCLTQDDARALLELYDVVAELTDQIPPAIAGRYPALERWRRRAMESRHASERAAAWEMTALDCELAGDTDSARLALGAAARTLLRRSA